MVLAHSRFSEYGNYWINMFHMPLFFFMAGYCFKDKYLSDCKEYTLRRIKGIYVPYVKWATVFLLLHNVFYSLNIYNDTYGFRGSVSHLYTLKEFAINEVHIITKMGGTEQLLGGYWFLYTFFVASILSYFVIKTCRKPLMGGGNSIDFSDGFVKVESSYALLRNRSTRVFFQCILCYRIRLQESELRSLQVPLVHNCRCSYSHYYRNEILASNIA